MRRFIFCTFNYGIAISLVFLLSTGCSRLTSSSEPGEEERYALANPEGMSLEDQDLALEDARWRDGSSIPAPAGGGIFEDVHFAYDSALVPEDAHEKIRQNAEFLRNNPGLFVEIEGHCDKRGTNEYNLALGEQRAKAVASLLTNYGIHASRLSTISYGEEIPLDPSDSESAYEKNRRVHFAVYRNKRPQN